jgi:GntR family transcriptional repressor for pyruvate dehydrogenase complex
MAITDDVIDRIKQMILSGELRPGDRLPREQDLAERLGVSRNSLREGVKALSLINILVVRQGDGTYVTSLDPPLLMDAMSFVVDFHQDDSVLYFLEVRRTLEGFAAAAAASSMTPAQLADLALSLERVDERSSVDDFVAGDMEFHRLIALGTGNPVLASLLDSLAAPTQRARIWRGLTQTSAVTQTLMEHRAIYNAIAARDGEVARARAITHVLGVEDWLRQSRHS